jgi:hypothetical protein
MRLPDTLPKRSAGPCLLTTRSAISVISSTGETSAAIRLNSPAFSSAARHSRRSENAIGASVAANCLTDRARAPGPVPYTPRVSRRTATLVILLLAVLPALLALRSRSFFSPDETSYAQVAREMIETHDFVVPTIDGKPWLEKPPLVYWLLAGAFAMLGWGFPAAVLLNALLTAGTALVIAAHVRRSAPPRAALLAAVAYLTMFLPLAAARSALTDPADRKSVV